MKIKIIKVKNYTDAEKKCPEGYRMLWDWELLKEIRTNKKSLLRCNGTYRWFYAKRTNEDIKKGHFAGLYSDGFGCRLCVGGYFYVDLGCAFGVFCKKKVANG